MVIGERFAWAHLAKTGGDATALMLAAVPGLVQFADPLDSNDKHTPFFVREPEITGRLLVMNIRRLPAWVLSGAHHRARYGEYPDYVPQTLETADQIAARTDADDLLRWMTDGDRFAVERWLRMESLVEDVIELVSALGARSEEVESLVRGVGIVNAGSYRRDLAARFTAEHVERLYELNPRWAAIERAVYGGLLAL